MVYIALVVYTGGQFSGLKEGREMRSAKQSIQNALYRTTAIKQPLTKILLPPEEGAEGRYRLYFKHRFLSIIKTFHFNSFTHLFLLHTIDTHIFIKMEETRKKQALEEVLCFIAQSPRVFIAK